MRTLPLFILPLTLAATLKLGAAEPESALVALNKLPASDRIQLARIEGREGNPTPDRWYFQVYAPEAQNGLREDVVTGGELVARRELSQFAQELKPDDMLGPTVRVDSDRVAKLAQQYVRANQLTVSAYHYTLSRTTPNAAPTWTVRCLGEAGEPIAALTVASDTGAVMTRDGFRVAPAATPAKPARVSVPVRRAIAVNPVEDRRALERLDRLEPVEEGPREERDARARREQPPRPPEPARRIVKPFERLFHDLLPFR